jgi:hypothetical protein
MTKSQLTARMLEVVGPLKARESRRAITAARRALPEGADVRGSELRFDKPRKRGQQPVRLVAVSALSRDLTEAFTILVDGKGELVEVRREQPSAIPISREEVDAAVAVATAADPALRRLTRRSSTFVSTFTPSAHDQHREPRGRLVGLRFAATGRGATARLLFSAVVDLTEGRLVQVARPDQTGGR